MKKVMISQPMNGCTDEEIRATAGRAIRYLESEGYEVVRSYFAEEYANKDELKDEGVLQIPVYFLSKALVKMSLCDAVYFCKGWEKARGCSIEHTVAQKYGLEVLYEEDLTERLEENDGEMTKEEMKEYLASTGLYDDSRASTFYEERMMSSSTMVSIKDLTERFIEVDAAYGGEPWNIKQILANIRMAKSEEEKE